MGSNQSLCFSGVELSGGRSFRFGMLCVCSLVLLESSIPLLCVYFGSHMLLVVLLHLLEIFGTAIPHFPEPLPDQVSMSLCHGVRHQSGDLSSGWPPLEPDELNALPSLVWLCVWVVCPSMMRKWGCMDLQCCLDAEVPRYIRCTRRLYHALGFVLWRTGAGLPLPQHGHAAGAAGGGGGGCVAAWGKAGWSSAERRPMPASWPCRYAISTCCMSGCGAGGAWGGCGGEPVLRLREIVRRVRRLCRGLHQGLEWGIRGVGVSGSCPWVARGFHWLRYQRACRHGRARYVRVVGPVGNMLCHWAEQTEQVWGGCCRCGLALPVCWACSVRVAAVNSALAWGLSVADLRGPRVASRTAGCPLLVAVWERGGWWWGGGGSRGQGAGPSWWLCPPVPPHPYRAPLPPRIRARSARPWSPNP